MNNISQNNNARNQTNNLSHTDTNQLYFARNKQHKNIKR